MWPSKRSFHECFVVTVNLVKYIAIIIGINKTFIGFLVTETGSEDDGLLDLSDDDFFLTGSSSDEADADDEWTDKSTRYLWADMILLQFGLFSSIFWIYVYSFSLLKNKLISKFEVLWVIYRLKYNYPCIHALWT